MNGTYGNNQTKKSCLELRAQAVQSLQGKWIIAILAMIIASILGAQLAMGGSSSGSVNLNVDTSDLSALFGDSSSTDNIFDEDFGFDDNVSTDAMDFEAMLQALKDAMPDLVEALSGPLAWTILVSFLMAIFLGVAISLAYTVFLGTPMRIGHLRFRLSLIDGEKADLAKVFSGFDRSYLPAIGLRVLRAIYLILWGLPATLLAIFGVVALVLGAVGSAVSMGGFDFLDSTLLLVGMVALLFSIGFSILPTIANFRYAMSDYIMAENPDIPVSEALRESARMMRGNKWRLFCLNLSFLGWMILCIFTCGIGFLWLNVYMYQAEAAMYHEISGREAIHGAIADMQELMEQL